MEAASTPFGITLDHDVTGNGGNADLMEDGMETKFTPGPWALDDISETDATYIVDWTGHEVLGCSEWLRVKYEDALLMAAAPELYDAVLTAIAEIECVAPDAGLAKDRLYRICDEMRALLAKARGE